MSAPATTESLSQNPSERFFLKAAYIPGPPTTLHKQTEHDLKTVRELFRHPGFRKALVSLRKKYDIPPDGFHLPPWGRRDLEMILTLDDETLRGCSIHRRSRKKPFDRDVATLVRNCRLSARFRDVMRTFVLYYKEKGAWLRYGIHATRTPIWHFKDECGEDRLFVEISGDTQRSNYINAWSTLHRLRLKLNLPGAQLFRNTHYYREERVYAGWLKPLHPITGEPQEVQEDEPDYSDDGRRLLAWRARKRRKKGHKPPRL